MTEAEMDPIDVGLASPSAAATVSGEIRVEVWFHAISSTDPVMGGDVSDTAVRSQLSVLNDAFDGGDVGVAPTPFRFVLAGVTRTTNAAWFRMGPRSDEERDAKRALRRGDARTLNIYTVQPTGTAIGWSTFPWAYRSNAYMDGIVVDHRTLPGGSAIGRGQGDLAVHEAGHWFGLYHTFQAGCEDPGDHVADTPPEASPAFGCPLLRDTCPTPGSDPIHNYMDYTNDACQDRFTGGQSLRMQEKWAEYRARGYRTTNR